MASLTNMPMEVKTKVCFELSDPLDRFNLGHAARSLKPAVDDSWRDLQTLTVVFPPDTDNSRTIGVEGTMTDPENRERSSFSHRICSAKVIEFLKWIGPRLSSLTLKTDDCREEKYSLISAADGHPISVVVSACADATVMPSVIDVSVMSRRLLFDRSLLDALIRWAECRRHTADNDDTAFWRSLSLIPEWSFFENQTRHESIEALKQANGEPPPEIQLLLRHGIGEMMLDADDTIQADSPSSHWRKGLTGMQMDKLRTSGSSDPEGDTKLVLSLLQKLMDRCESLRTLDIDFMLRFLELRPTMLHYPKTLTKLKCDRLGEVVGEIAVIVENCPLLEDISVDCSSIRDIVALTKLKQLERLELKDVLMTLQFILSVFGVDSVDELLQIGPESSPWPMLEKICWRNGSDSDHIKCTPHQFVAALINCCPNLSSFDISCCYDYGAATADVVLGLLLCRLPRLRRLHFYGARYFHQLHVDSLPTCCPNLQELELELLCDPFVLDPLLLRSCPELRTVEVMNLSIDLTEPDDVAMLLGIAADVGDRKRRVVIECCRLDGVSQVSLDAIVVGLPPDVRLCLSDVHDVCLHGRRRCSRCRFEDDREECHSIVIGHSRRLHATVVFQFNMPIDDDDSLESD